MATEAQKEALKAIGVEVQSIKPEEKPAKVGRPLLFKTKQELDDKINIYFQDCIDKNKPLTISGLAVALDTSRQTLLNYERREEYFDSIKRALSICERFAEERLFSNSPTGAIFNLKNNYGDWNKDKEGGGVQVNIFSLNQLFTQAEEEKEKGE